MKKALGIGAFPTELTLNLIQKLPIPVVEFSETITILSFIQQRNKNLILFEDDIKQVDISKNIQRFQLAIDEAKVRLDLAISPDTWLMPLNLERNTQSTVSYNNVLKKATKDMKLGVNSSQLESTPSTLIRRDWGLS